MTFWNFFSRQESKQLRIAYVQLKKYVDKEMFIVLFPCLYFAVWNWSCQPFQLLPGCHLKDSWGEMFLNHLKTLQNSNDIAISVVSKQQLTRIYAFQILMIAFCKWINAHTILPLGSSNLFHYKYPLDLPSSMPNIQ